MSYLPWCFPLLKCIAEWLGSFIHSYRYQELRKKQQEEMEARKQRNKERLEKVARGEEAEPLEKEEQDEPVNITLWHLIKFLVILTAIVMGSGFFITGDPFWDYQGKWRRIATYLPV